MYSVHNISVTVERSKIMTTVEPIRNKSDIKKVENILANQSKRDLLLFEIGINWLSRISDILRLNVSDVRNRTHIQITEQKTGKFKKFPINSKLKPMIDDFIKGRRNTEPLFLSVWNHRLDRTTSYYIIRTACEKAGQQRKSWYAYYEKNIRLSPLPTIQRCCNVHKKYLIIQVRKSL